MLCGSCIVAPSRTAPLEKEAEDEKGMSNFLGDCIASQLDFHELRHDIPCYSLGQDVWRYR